MNEIKTLKEIVSSLRDCEYTCEAGPLVNNEDFRTLAKLAGVELPKTLDESAKELGEALRKTGIRIGEALRKTGIRIGEAFEAIGRLTVHTPQQVRDEIIEKAKRDVEGLTLEGVAKLKTDWLSIASCNVKFIVNKEKRTVVALLYGAVTKKLRAKGIAKCAPNDCFNVHIGKAIALRRALGIEVPSEYLTAPQPMGVRVGDKIFLNFNEKIETVSGFNYGGYALTRESPGCVEQDDYVIIDDSRDEVAE